MAMPHQIGVTIQAPVAVDRVPELRAWLAEISRKGLAEGPFDLAHVRGLHFARFYLLEETADLEGRSIPASLVFMSAVDAPLRRHLADLVDVAGEGMDQAFRHCTGYPGPDARRRAKIAWLRGHRVAASAFYVNTVGRGLEQIRQEAAVRGELQAYAAGRADLAWAQRPPAPPSVFFRAREAVHMAAVPLALALLLPVLLLILPVWAVALRLE